MTWSHDTQVEELALSGCVEDLDQEEASTLQSSMPMTAAPIETALSRLAAQHQEITALRAALSSQADVRTLPGVKSPADRQ